MLSVPPPSPAQSVCGVLGRPIAHSLSPVLHRAAYAALDLPWEYAAHHVGEADLPGFVAGLGPEWRGLSLTMPLKRAVLPLLDEVSPVAEAAGAANTVVVADGRLLGDNTDVPGFAGALRERGLTAPRSALVVGGGATAASALLALATLGCAHARLVVRDPARAAATLAAVHAHPSPPLVTVTRLADLVAGSVEVEADLVVSTVPVEAQDPALVAVTAQAPAVFEVVYDPWPSPLAVAAEARGATVLDGLDLLAHQAVLQVELMTGHPVAVDLLRDAGREALRRRSS